MCNASYDVIDDNLLRSNLNAMGQFQCVAKLSTKPALTCLYPEGEFILDISVRSKEVMLLWKQETRGCRLSLSSVEDVRQPATLTHSCFSLPITSPRVSSQSL